MRARAPSLESFLNAMHYRVHSYSTKIYGAVPKESIVKCLLEEDKEFYSDVVSNYPELYSKLLEREVVSGSFSIWILSGDRPLFYVFCTERISKNAVQITDPFLQQIKELNEAHRKVSVTEDLYGLIKNQFPKSLNSYKEIVTLLPACQHFQKQVPYKRMPTHLYLKGAAELNAKIAQLHFLLNLEGV